MFSILFLAVLGACEHTSNILDEASFISPEGLSQITGNGKAFISQKIIETNPVQMAQNESGHLPLNHSNSMNHKQTIARSSFDEFMEFLATAPSDVEITEYLTARKYKKLENINRDIPYLNEIEHVYFNIEDYLCSGVPIRISLFEHINNKASSKPFYNINMDRGYPKTFECSNSARTESFDHKYLKDYLLSHGWKIDKYDRASRFLTIHFIKGNAKILVEYQSVYLENVLLVTHNFNIDDFWKSHAYVNYIVYGYSLK